MRGCLAGHVVPDMATRPIGVFGGTFDPIHLGHLRTALELRNTLDCREIRFLPCGLPPHRALPIADAETRAQMVRLAVGNEPGFVIDERELSRGGPSYSVDTLESLRAEFPTDPLCLFVGMDAFLGLPRWHRWERIFELAHIVVAHRPGWRVPARGPLGALISQRGRTKPDALHEEPNGYIFVHAVTQLEISSTEIRELIRSGRDPRFLMPDVVRDFVQQSGCYAPESNNTGG